MKPQNIGELIDQMIRLAVKNPKVLDKNYTGKGATEYQTIKSQLVKYFAPVVIGVAPYERPKSNIIRTEYVSDTEHDPESEDHFPFD